MKISDSRAERSGVHAPHERGRRGATFHPLRARFACCEVSLETCGEAFTMTALRCRSQSKSTHGRKIVTHTPQQGLRMHAPQRPSSGSKCGSGEKREAASASIEKDRAARPRDEGAASTRRGRTAES